MNEDPRNGSLAYNCIYFCSEIFVLSSNVGLCSRQFWIDKRSLQSISISVTWQKLSLFTASLAEIHSRQNNVSDHQTKTDDNVNLSSSTKSYHRDDKDDEDLPPSSSSTRYGTSTRYMSSRIPVQTTSMGINYVQGLSSLQITHKFWKVVCDENLEPHCFSPWSRT